MAEFDLVAADKLIAANVAGERTACEKGCAWCCHQLIVMTNRSDGAAMLDKARATMSAEEFAQVEASLREQATEIGAMSYEEAESRQWACPFLRENVCTVYDVRPIACRSVFSSDAECCKAMMQVDRFADLSAEFRKLATEIGERAMALQFAINDSRPVTGAVEMRSLLVELLDERHGT
jgi:Fe-S-cluster containining protein